MPSILVIGTVLPLLATRAMVLSTTDADIVETHLKELESVPRSAAFDLVFLCHSLEGDQRHFAARWVRNVWPDSCLIQVKGMWETNLIVPGYADAAVPCDPRLMVCMTRRLLDSLPAQVS